VKYSQPNSKKSEYVCIHGNVYDAEFISDEDGYEKAREGLRVRRDMWYIRIAVDKVEFQP